MIKDLTKILETIKKEAKKKKIKTGFFIGNTAKLNNSKSYFTPIRNLAQIISAGAIVYTEKQAMDISKIIDGNVDYVFVDAEKKISDDKSVDGETANIERVVREHVIKSKLFLYKGNDLSVDSVDSLLSYIHKDNLTGIGGKKVCILGSGNLGTKLAIKLVERGANITITRRNKTKLKTITNAINIIKPKYTKAKVKYETDNLKASKNSEILIGCTNGVETITSTMIKNISNNCIIVEVGKGTLSLKAVNEANVRGHKIYRLDITSALIGLISQQLSLDDNIVNKMGKKIIMGETIISGGLLGNKNDIVVDNFQKPKFIFGIANGQGDFIQKLSKKNIKSLKNIKKILKIKN